MLYTCECCHATTDKPVLTAFPDLGLVAFGGKLLPTSSRVAQLLFIMIQRGPATASQLALRLLNDPEKTALTYQYITKLREALRRFNIGVAQNTDGRYEIKLP